MIQMIVSDLDGTLLMPDEQGVSQEVLQMVTSLQKDNCRFTIASGRSYSALKRMFSGFINSMYFICENGALIQYQGRTIYKKTVPRKTTIQLLQQMEALGCEWVAAGVHTIYTSNHCAETVAFYRENKIPIMKISSIGEIPEDVIRISVLNKEKKVSVVDMWKQVGQGTRISYQDDSWTDVINEEANKGEALQWLLNKLSMNPNNIAVFGDNTNDIEMLKLTPNSYAMSQTSREIQAIANHITDSVIKSVTNM